MTDTMKAYLLSIGVPAWMVRSLESVGITDASACAFASCWVKAKETP